VARASTTFVGRAAELDILRAALARTATGSSSLVVVSGESGIGKSRLLDRFSAETRSSTAAGPTAEAAPEPLVLRGRCSPVTGEAVAFGPLTMLLREALRIAPELADVIAARAPDVVNLLPAGVIDVPAPTPLGGELGHLGLLEACRLVLTEAAIARPVVAIVEDLQWADRSSTGALAYLTGSAQPAGLMVVVSYRTEDLPRHHHAHPIIREMESRNGTDIVRLPPFGTVELRAQLHELLQAEPTEDLVQDLAERSGGHPLFTEELVAAGASAVTATIPKSLADLLISQIEPLPRPQQRLLRVAAAIGRQVHPDILARTLDAEPNDVAAGTRDVVASGILVPVDERLEFRHELLREAVYAMLLPGERKPLHAAVARSLTAHPELAPSDWCHGELAYHWQLAGDSRAALQISAQAAKEARAIGAVADAARYGAQALELWDTVDNAEELIGCGQADLLMQIADDSLLGGGIPAHTWAARALDLLDAQAEPARYALVAVRLAHFELMAGRPSRALATAAEATTIMATQPDSRDKARVTAEHAQILMYCERYDESRHLSHAAQELAHELGDRLVEVMAGGIHGVALVTLGDWRAGLEVLQDASALARELADEDGAAESRARAAMSESFCLYWLGFPEKAYQVARAGLEAASRAGLGLSLGFSLRVSAATMAVTAGQLDTADALLTDASPSLVQRLSRFLAEARASLATARGEYDQAHEALTGVEANQIAPVGLSNLGPIEVALGQHRLDDARARVTALLDAALQLGITWQVAPLAALGAAVEGETLLQCETSGDVDGARLARKRAEELLAQCTRTSEDIITIAGELPPSVLGWTAIAEARLVEISGEPAAPAWRLAAKVCVGAGFPLLVLQCRFEAARACLAAGDRDAAAGELEALIDQAAQVGVEYHVVAARELADRAGIRLGRKAGTDTRTSRDRLGLTEREIQVLALVAEGMTNREVAAALFLSPKTVSVHITNVLRKLDVTSRHDAARLASGLGLL
jgi:DNA-binding CsgD family transcriptional regulator